MLLEMNFVESSELTFGLGHDSYSFAYLRYTVYLQGCLARKRCSERSLSGRYLNPYIKLKLIELAIKLYKKIEIKGIAKFFMATKCERPNHISKATSQSEFCFRQFHFFLGFRAQSAKKNVSAFCHIQLQ